MSGGAIFALFFGRRRRTEDGTRWVVRSPDAGMKGDIVYPTLSISFDDIDMEDRLDPTYPVAPRSPNQIAVTDPDQYCSHPKASRTHWAQKRNSTSVHQIAGSRRGQRGKRSILRQRPRLRSVWPLRFLRQRKLLIPRVYPQTSSALDLSHVRWGDKRKDPIGKGQGCPEDRPYHQRPSKTR